MKKPTVLLALATLVACSPVKASVGYEILQLEYCNTLTDLANNIIVSRQAGRTKEDMLSVSDLSESQKLVHKSFTLDWPNNKEEANRQKAKFKLDTLESCLREIGY